MLKTILIIEDNPSLIKALKSKFEASSHRVAYAMDGEEGIEMFDKTKPDLVLLDIAMPKKNGLEVLEYIRNESHSDLPVVLFSNFDDFENTEQAKRLGVSSIILKANTSLADLSHNINQLLESK